MMNRNFSERNIRNILPSVTKQVRASEANEILALSTEFKSDQLGLIRSGMVRVEVVDSQRRIISADVYSEESFCPVPVNLTFLTKMEIREIRIVALKAGTAMVFYDQVDYEMMLLKSNRDAYTLYRDLLNSLTVNLFSNKTYFAKDGVLIDQFVSQMVKMHCKYMIMQETHNYLETQLKSAQHKKAKEVPVLVSLSKQDGFWVNISVSQASFHRAQTILINQGVVIGDPKYREAFSICIDLIKLMEHYSTEYYDALNEIDNTQGHFSQLREAMNH